MHSTDHWLASTQSGYDRVAAEYAARIYGELAHKPRDRELLDKIAERVRGRGLVVDMGCGPGQVARYLADRGLPVMGVDLSPGMLAQARRLNPGIEFQAGNMLSLAAPAGSWAGIAAFYSIIHIPRPLVVEALREFCRVLRPGGALLLAFHIGADSVHLDEWWDQAVSIDFEFFEPDEMTANVRAAGLVVDEIIERAPYAPEIEHQSRRAYVFASKPHLC